jgi:hypothetical protein
MPLVGFVGSEIPSPSLCMGCSGHDSVALLSVRVAACLNCQRSQSTGAALIRAIHHVNVASRLWRARLAKLFWRLPSKSVEVRSLPVRRLKFFGIVLTLNGEQFSAKSDHTLKQPKRGKTP